MVSIDSGAVLSILCNGVKGVLSLIVSAVAGLSLGSWESAGKSRSFEDWESDWLLLPVPMLDWESDPLAWDFVPSSLMARSSSLATARRMKPSHTSARYSSESCCSTECPRAEAQWVTQRARESIWRNNRRLIINF